MPEEETTTEEPAAEAAGAEEVAAEETVEESRRELPEQAALATIVGPFASTSWVTAADEWVVSVNAEDYIGLVEAAKANGFDMFIDLCGVDYFRRDPRFEVMLTLLNTSTPMRLRIRAGVPGTDPQLPTASDLFPGADFYERETYDLLGIDFVGHADLTRILLPDEWVGHPLRKDYDIGSVPIQFKDAHKAT